MVYFPITDSERNGKGVDGERLIGIARACGVDGAALVGREDIVLNAEFRGMCADNRCGMYGRCYMCPPDVGPIEELMARVRGYEQGLLYQVISPLEDSFDLEGMAAAKRRMVAVSQRLLDALGPVLGEGALHLAAGGCGLCERCAKESGTPCPHPDRALASLESHGIDVYATTRSTALKYVNGANTVTYFGMVLFSGGNDG